MKKELSVLRAAIAKGASVFEDQEALEENTLEEETAAEVLILITGGIFQRLGYTDATSTEMLAFTAAALCNGRGGNGVLAPIQEVQNEENEVMALGAKASYFNPGLTKQQYAAKHAMQVWKRYYVESQASRQKVEIKKANGDRRRAR